MNYFEEKEIKDFNKKIRDTFNFLTINGKYNIIGSASLKKIKYASDYDLEELNSKNKDSEQIRTNIYKMFKSKFEEGKKDRTVFITDFKCGQLNGEPLRWTSQNIKTGINNGVRFQDALIQKSTIKLDVIRLINNKYTEFSENYYFQLGSDSNFNKEDATKENILKSISESADEYKEENNYFKVLKRSFAYKLLENRNKYKNQLIKMIDFFNTDTGLLYKSRGDLDVLILILENKFRKSKIEDIQTNLNIIYHNISGLISPKINECFEKLFQINTKKQLITHINKIISNINILVNKQTIKFLKIKKNRNLII